MERQLEAVGEGLPNRAQAEEIMQRSLKVLYYRDKSTYNNWSIGFAEKVSVANFIVKTFDQGSTDSSVRVCLKISNFSRFRSVGPCPRTTRPYL